ncbi:MAG: hypothetical protein ACRDJN_16685 [Chloroflexota bacterium]
MMRTYDLDLLGELFGGGVVARHYEFLAPDDAAAEQRAARIGAQHFVRVVDYELCRLDGRAWSTVHPLADEHEALFAEALGARRTVVLRVGDDVDDVDDLDGATLTISGLGPGPGPEAVN